MWRVVNGKVQGYCKLLFQECYDHSKENEVIVTLCDGNPHIEEQEVETTKELIKREIEDVVGEYPEVAESLDEVFDPEEDLI